MPHSYGTSSSASAWVNWSPGERKSGETNCVLARCRHLGETIASDLCRRSPEPVRIKEFM
jgi:hypothetical protein